MESCDVLIEAYGRVAGLVHAAVTGLAPNDLAHRFTPEANSIGWLVWHLTRIQDAQVSNLASVEQAWTAAGWMAKCGLPFAASATGYAHTSDEVSKVVGVTSDLLGDYYDAVGSRTLAYLGTLSAEDLDHVVDERFDPPVTRGVRLVSVLSDNLQHAGQALILRGFLPPSL